MMESMAKPVMELKSGEQGSLPSPPQIKNIQIACVVFFENEVCTS